MNKDIKKCYEILDLPMCATVEDVEARKKALIKIYNNKGMEKGISYEKQIGMVEESANKIIENLAINQTPLKENHHFECSWGNVAILFIVLVFAVGLAWFSFNLFN